MQENSNYSEGKLSSSSSGDGSEAVRGAGVSWKLWSYSVFSFGVCSCLLNPLVVYIFAFLFFFVFYNMYLLFFGFTRLVEVRVVNLYN